MPKLHFTTKKKPEYRVITKFKILSPLKRLKINKLLVDFHITFFILTTFFCSTGNQQLDSESVTLNFSVASQVCFLCCNVADPDPALNFQSFGSGSNPYYLSIIGNKKNRPLNSINEEFTNYLPIYIS